jgi:hypothetical protein
MKEWKQKKQILGHVIKYFLKKYIYRKNKQNRPEKKREKCLIVIKKPDLIKNRNLTFFFSNFKIESKQTKKQK